MLLACLGDVPVLTEATAKVAAGGSEREHAAAGVEVVERLFFDRVDAEARGLSVAGQHDRAVPGFPHETKPALPVVHTAVAWAGVTLHPAVRHGLPEFSPHDARR
jgi:hypothetical protein